VPVGGAEGGEVRIAELRAHRLEGGHLILAALRLRGVHVAVSSAWRITYATVELDVGIQAERARSCSAIPHATMQ
jgi:hypothetical protein